jgi:hypothetical protein
VMMGDMLNQADKMIVLITNSKSQRAIKEG